MNADLIKNLVATVLAQETNTITDTRITAEVDKFLSLYPNVQPEREHILNHLRANFSVTSDEYQILDTDEANRIEPWVRAKRASGELKWRFWERYQMYLQPRMAVHTLNRLDDLTNDILDRLMDPKTLGLVWSGLAGRSKCLT